MSSPDFAATNVATAFLAGVWTLPGLRRRAEEACGVSNRRFRQFVRRVFDRFKPADPEPDLATVAAFVAADPGFSGNEFVKRIFWLKPVMTPSAAAGRWGVPPLTTTVAVADWLGVSPGALDWFADLQGRNRRTDSGRRRHYSCRWLRKRSGGWRLLETPKARVKAVQRQILHGILDHVPPHDAAHGYCRGRSIRTFAEPHCGRQMVLRFDLREFFASVRASRVHRVFRAAGYPPAVARVLTGLCTTTAPTDLASPGLEFGAPPVRPTDEDRYRTRHLPQGAPTSPALANLAAFRLDRRLAALARAAGAVYTRYADDLAFSGDGRLERSARRFQVKMCEVALDEGFEVNTRKSRFMRRGLRQQVVGVVVNARPNVGRDEFDTLKAILTNSARRGPASQNRDRHPDFRAYLLGRIGHVATLNPARGAKLMRAFGRIGWDDRQGVSEPARE